MKQREKTQQWYVLLSLSILKRRSSSYEIPLLKLHLVGSFFRANVITHSQPRKVSP
jgi:hypothetical protein